LRNAATQSSPISFPPLPIARGRRIPPRASMTGARRGSRRLFRATALFFRQTDDDIAIAFAYAAHGRQLIDRLAVDDKRIAAPVVAFRGIRQASRDCPIGASAEIEIVTIAVYLAIGAPASSR
jgi:hypothetical protein